MGVIAFAPDEAQEVARALAWVAAADGAILGREASFLDEFAMNHSVGGLAFIPSPLDIDRLARVVTGVDQRMEVLRLCVRIAIADGEYADAEARAIGRIAVAFGVGEEELATLVAATRARR